MSLNYKFESERLEERKQGIRESAPLGYFGFKPFDDLLGGYYADRVNALAGRPGISKTTLIGFLMDKLARQNAIAIVLSMDVSSQFMVNRTFVRSRQGEITVDELCKSSETPDADAIVANYGETIANNLIYLDDPISAVELGGIIGDVKSRRPNQHIVVAVDYAQVWNPNPDDHQAKDIRAIINEAVLALRQISRVYKVPVFIISSIARKEYDKVGPLSCLAESGIFDYNCDQIMQLSIDGTPKEQEELLSVPVKPVRLTLLKNRFGVLGSTTFLYDAPHATFLEIE